MKMKKQVIRLTEADLHRVIKESVNRILKESQLITELDPRTYASYAQKRANQGLGLRAMKGVKAAINSWNREYGSTDNNATIYDKNGGAHEAERRNRLYTTNDTNPYHKGKQIEYAPYQELDSKEIGDYYNPKYSNHSSMRGLGNYSSKVAQQMSDGSGKYIKGQGWQ